MATDEPMFEVAQLAHMELLTPKPDETLWFFKDLLGMQETERQGQSVYLRAYEDTYHHSLKVTEAAEPGMGHAAFRTHSPKALERRIQALDAIGLGRGWIDGDNGHGPAYRFETPDGHKLELLWEVDYWQAPEGQESCIINRPQKRPLQGIPVRRIDHINLLASEVTPTKDFFIDQLGFRLREHIIDDGTEVGAWISVSNLVHEVAIMKDATNSRGRLHHVAYWYGIPQHTSDCAEILSEYGITIEAGPGKHGISQALFMYVFEPGGNRVELFGDSGYLIFDPAWKPVCWKGEDLEKGIVFYGSPLPQEYFLVGTPHAEVPAEAAEAGSARETVEASA